MTDLMPAATLDSLPGLLLPMLERRYLEGGDGRWELAVEGRPEAEPLLQEVTALGRPRPEDTDPPMPRFLTASHALGNTIVLAAHGTGRAQRLLVGGRRIPGRSGDSAEDILRAQTRLLGTQAGGLRLGPEHRSGDDGLATFLRSAPAIGVVTGIPSKLVNAGARPVGLDQFMNGMGDRRYALVVAAEPLLATDLDQSIAVCRQLRSAVAGLKRVTVQMTTARTESTGQSQSTPTAPTNVLPAAVAGMVTFAVAAFAGPAAGGGLAALTALPGMMGLASSLTGTGGGARSTHTAISESAGHAISLEVLDADAEACDRLLGEHLDRLYAARSRGWWQVSVYLAAESESALAWAAAGLRGLASGDATGLDPIRLLRPEPWLVRDAAITGRAITMRVARAAVSHPFGTAYDALATCVTSDELAVLTELPRREVPGLAMADVSRFALTLPPPAEVTLGELCDDAGDTLGPVTLPGRALNRHTLITGMTGYGKTTTAMRMLIDAYRELEVPFLVVEPVKREYRRLATHPDLQGRLTVFTVGGDGTPLRINPLAPVPGVPLQRHIDLVKAIFNASFAMFAGMPQVLEQALIEVYRDRGWDLESSANKLLTADPAVLDALTPTIADLEAKVVEVVTAKGYGGDVYTNMTAALRSRLNGLMVGAKGRTLNVPRSVPLRDLFGRPCVVELANLGDDEEKSFVMALLLGLLYEFAETRLIGEKEKLRHLTLIEEAHRVVPAQRGLSGSDIPNARAEAVAMFTNMLAEMRAYGEGFIVADQIPSKIAPEVLKNSNVKIVHRLVAADDRAIVGATMNLTEAQIQRLATLEPGQAVVSEERISGAVLVTVPPRPDLPALAPLPAGDPPRRTAGCRHCPTPCVFLPRTDELRGTPVAPFALDRFFAILLDGPADQVEASWQRFRETWVHALRRAGDDDIDGLTYCYVTRQAESWLLRWSAHRNRAVGLPGPTPAQRVRLAHASVVIAGLVWALRDEAGPARVPAAVHAELRGILTTAPPRELTGCVRCPDRCQALSAIAGNTALRETVRVQITAKTDPAVRLQKVNEACGIHATVPVTPAVVRCAITTTMPEHAGTEALLDLLEGSSTP